MSILAWNIRGLNDPNKVKEIKHYLDSQHVSIVGLLETRVKEKNTKRIQQKFGNNRC